VNDYYAPGGLFEQERQRELNELEYQRLVARKEAEVRYATEVAQKNPAPVFDLGLLDDIPDLPVAWRIEGLLPEKGRLLVAAQRKTGKTTLGLNIARCVITGERLLGKLDTTPTDGRVALFNYEVSGAQAARWARDHGIPGDRLVLVNLRGRRNPLGHPEDQAALMAKMIEHDVRMLIVDPFGRAFTGSSQNDSTEVQSWLLNLDQFATDAGIGEVVLMTHAGWNGERTRGSSALEDWPDAVVWMVRGTDARGQEDGTRFLRAEGRDVDIEEDQFTYDETTRMIRFANTGSRAHTRKTVQMDAVMSALVDYVKRHPGASTKAIEEGLRAEGAVRFQKGDVARASRSAQSKGLIHVKPGSRGAHEHFHGGAVPDDVDIFL
jgi:hypothetical protein